MKSLMSHFSQLYSVPSLTGCSASRYKKRPSIKAKKNNNNNNKKNFTIKRSIHMGDICDAQNMIMHIGYVTVIRPNVLNSLGYPKQKIAIEILKKTLESDSLDS